jgi:hypothetical protein
MKAIEHVIVTYSKDGWAQLLSCIPSGVTNHEIITVIDNCETHLIDINGCHFIDFGYIDVAEYAFSSFLRYNEMNILDKDFLWISVSASGDEFQLGEYVTNPFNMKVKKSISFNIFGSEYSQKLENDPLLNKSPTVVPIVIDNHTCICGNTKCNKTEKSCWKCGHPISG